MNYKTISLAIAATVSAGCVDGLSSGYKTRPQQIAARGFR